MAAVGLGALLRCSTSCCSHAQPGWPAACTPGAGRSLPPPPPGRPAAADVRRPPARSPAAHPHRCCTGCAPRGATPRGGGLGRRHAPVALLEAPGPLLPGVHGMLHPRRAPEPVGRPPGHSERRAARTHGPRLLVLTLQAMRSRKRPGQARHAALGAAWRRSTQCMANGRRPSASERALRFATAATEGQKLNSAIPPLAEPGAARTRPPHYGPVSGRGLGGLHRPPLFRQRLASV